MNAFLTSLTGIVAPRHRRWFDPRAVVFELQATAAGVRHYLLMPRELVPFVTGAIRATLPRVSIEQVATYSPIKPALAGELTLSDARRPLRTDAPEAISASVLAATQPLKEEQAIAMQWIVAPTGPIPAEPGLARAAQIPAEALRARRAKRASALFEASGRFGVVADRKSARQRLRYITGVWHGLNSPGAHLRRRTIPSLLTAWQIRGHRLPVLPFPLLLNVDELVGVIAWPLGAAHLPGLRLDASRRLFPEERIPRSGIKLGDANAVDPGRAVCIPAVEVLRHSIVTGPTGTGKTTLLKNMMLQLIQIGHGVISFEPKADGIPTLLQRIPAARRRDVIVIDPMDDAAPIGVDLFAAAAFDKELAADELLGILHSVYRQFWGPRTSMILGRALRTLLHLPEPSICDLPKLLLDQGYRRTCVPVAVAADATLGGFWGWFEALSPAERLQVCGPVLTKLDGFTSRRRIRDCIGQSRPRFDFASAMAAGKIVLVNLPPGSLGTETTELLGALLLAAVWWAARARSMSNLRPYALFLDEAHHFVGLPTDISEMLTEARGHALGLVLGVQHLHQMPPGVRAAAMGNAGTRVCFQLSADDARTFAREFAPHLSAEDLMHLRPFDAVTQVSIGGARSLPTTITTTPLPAALSGTQDIRARSQAEYGRSRAELDAEQARRYAPTARAQIGRAK